MKTTNINVLGTNYIVISGAKAEDYPELNGADGYCDYTSKMIVIRAKDINDNADNLQVFIDKVLRHEIIHAFLNESGLQFDSQDERMVDWLAIQFPKMAKVFDELNI